ncbi:MAG: NrfD/PsrC family molybdoenzyme membrane anchor subunit [Candidatus Competibacteraceae bacterium]|jgi:molybdopterin-containing oxidoreductase family membrane subunit|nr:NrfD/PsrC family molybdoenzyme membrane anchor subunit [Candidatus Competibacteraceae bacterium]
MTLFNFLRDGVREMLRGGWLYRIWLGVLLIVIVIGVGFYVNQLRFGLVTTGMSDQVSWGFYIANFAFLVGVAASAVLLVVPAYVFHRKDIKDVVLLGEGMAVAAVVTAMLFVIVDMGRPDRLWHMIPLLGRFNFPISLLAWDVVVLTGYLLLNLCIPLLMLFTRYRGGEPNLNLYFPFILLAIVWAISIHTVTAFLFSANSARPFWHTALLGPRFIASAFVSGPALFILALQLIRRTANYPVSPKVIDTLAIIMTIALQISLFFVIAELFTDFYNEGEHAASVHYLYLGLEGFQALRPWIWSALALNITAVIILMIHPLRRNRVTLSLACVLAFVGIWIEKGMGLVVPGFIPTPLGEIFEYTPTANEILIAIGCWSVGILIFTLLAKAGISIETGRLRQAAEQ